ncbi:MAG: RNA polymerase sigma factor [Saprospiraceae bacterium]|nr:RNA polymerase sigma factor [Saprospiraceae bacterium]
MQQEDRFIELIKEHEGVIFKITSIYARNAMDQKDLYQEIVAQLWTAYDKFRGEAKVSTWIYRIALNTAITKLRKDKKLAKTKEVDWVLQYTDQRDPVQEKRIRQLYQKIELLNDLEKGIILLFLEDRTYEEIATITGLTLTNVATRLSRIRKKLRTQMLKETKIDRYGAR